MNTVFDKQLKVGEKGERLFADYYSAKGWECEHVDDNDQNVRGDYDFRCIKDGLTQLAEVKMDERAEQTGNAYIELTQSGLPSGLNTTKSDIWVHITSKRMFICKTLLLRVLVCQSCCREVAMVNADGYKTTGKLVPLNFLQTGVIESLNLEDIRCQMST